MSKNSTLKVKFLFRKEYFYKTKFGAWVIYEPCFTGSRDLCELWKYVNHNFFLLYL